MTSKRRVPSYRLHKASGQAIVVLSGTTHYLGPWQSDSSRAEYDRVMAEWFAGGRVPSRGPSLSVNELVLAYWRHVQSYYVKDGRPTSEVETTRQALRFMRPSTGRPGRTTSARWP